MENIKQEVVDGISPSRGCVRTHAKPHSGLHSEPVMHSIEYSCGATRRLLVCSPSPRMYMYITYPSVLDLARFKCRRAKRTYPPRGWIIVYRSILARLPHRVSVSLPFAKLFKRTCICFHVGVYLFMNV